MKELAPSGKSLTFNIYKLLVDINYARTWEWSEDNKRDTHIKRNTYYLSVHKVERTDYDGLSIIQIVFGPLKIQLGISK